MGASDVNLYCYITISAISALNVKQNKTQSVKCKTKCKTNTQSITYKTKRNKRKKKQSIKCKTKQNKL